MGPSVKKPDSKTQNQVVIEIDSLTPGIRLPAPAYDGAHSSTLLLNRGQLLSQQLLDRLKARGVLSISISADAAAILERGSRRTAVKAPPDKVAPQGVSPAEPAPKPSTVSRSVVTLQNQTGRYSPQLVLAVRDMRQRHLKQMSAVYRPTSYGTSFSGTTIQEIAAESVESLCEDIDIYVRECLGSLEKTNGCEHSVKVAQLALAVGAVMKLGRDQLTALGVGCLLHRIGTTNDVRALMESRRTLSVIERLEVRKVPAKTFDLLQRVPDVPPLAGQVAYQIYERWNGTGYPRQRMGVQISPLARIASVCDVFTALTSERPHRPAWGHYKAVELVLQQTRKGEFDPTAVRGLLKTISLYPLGTMVRLNDDRTARVVRTNTENYDRPLIEVFRDEYQQEGTLVDLSSQPQLRVVEVLSTDEVILSSSETNHASPVSGRAG